MDSRQCYIDGAGVWPDQRHDFEVINPATEAPAGVISLGQKADVDKAVAAARQAFDGWSRSTVAARLAILQNIRTIYQRRAEELSQAMTAEMGSPISFSRSQQTPSGEAHITTTIEALESFAFQQLSPRGGSEVFAEPVGVAALITPWNWPINQIMAKVMPALATGCTCVLKPSEIAPLSALIFAEIMDEAGVPAGVFNLVNGDGQGVGQLLSCHPGVDLVSFTGSTRAGTAISQAAAATVKRVTLELGGKSPNLLFADADLEQATRWSVGNCFGNTGQTCDAPTRLLVERPVYDQVLAIAADAAVTTAVGDPLTVGDHLGPLVSEVQFAKVQTMIKTGLDEGARLIAGGLGRPTGMAEGYFVKPTVFADVHPQMVISREEIFGPVLCITPVDGEADAIDLANDTPYGLAAYIQTADLVRAGRVARQLRAGLISINGGYPDVDAPFGGFKQSGNGRENGGFGFHDFLDLKTVTVG